MTLDNDFEKQTLGLSASQRAAIREWQKTSRFYELIQSLKRGMLDRSNLGPGELGRLVDMIDDLEAAIAAGSVPRRMTVYRGVRNLEHTFGTDDLDVLVDGRERVMPGFTAASVVRDVALSEFSGPRGGLLEIDVPSGVSALWVAGAGDPRLRYQGEVLFRDRLRLRVTAARREGDLTVLSVLVVE